MATLVVLKPMKFKADEIPFYARLMAIADVDDALIGEHLYKRVFSHRGACDIIVEDRGTQRAILCAIDHNFVL